MADAFHLAVVAAAVSGLALALLGLPLVLSRPRHASKTAFGLFLALWGSLVLFGNLSRLRALEGDLAAAEGWVVWTLAPLVCLYLPVVYFASTYPARRGSFARSTAAMVALLAPAALGAAALNLAPALFFRGLVGEPPLVLSAWGPLYTAYTFLFIGSLYYAVFQLHRSWASTPRRVEARRALAVLLALLLYVGFFAAETSAFYGGRFAAGQPVGGEPWQDAALVVLALAGVGLVAAVGRGLLAARPGRTARDRLVAASAAALPLGLGALSGATKLVPGVPPVEALGFLRLASAALIVYAILRFELFDVEVKAKRGAVAAVVLGGAGLAAIALGQAATGTQGSAGAWVALLQVLLVGAVLAVLVRTPALAWASRRVLARVDAPDRLDARRLEVYEAALAQALGEDALEQRAAFLQDLRRRLDISEGEHAALLRLVQAPRAALTEEVRLEPRATIAGRYRLERLLGEGAFGRAYLAWDEASGRRVVLKALRRQRVGDEEAVRQFLREGRVAASLEHRNVIRLFDSGYAGDTPFVVLEYAEGGSLAQRLAREGRLAPEDAVRVAREVLAGLAEVHARGLLHLDVKPANVLLAADGTAKVTDFGIARHIDPTKTQVGLGGQGIPQGTPAYMSTEAVQGLRMGPASDVYSTGALLYEMLSGTTYRPFEGLDAFGLRRAILEEPPRELPVEVPEALRRAVLRALEKDPAQRYASADEMRAALEAAVPGPAAQAGPLRESTGATAA